MQELASSSFCQQHNVRSIPASFTSAAHQKLLDIMGISSFPNPSRLSQSQLSAQWHQRQQTFTENISNDGNMRHSSRSPDEELSLSRDDKIKQDCPLLLKLLTNPDNKNLDNDQIIKLIETRRIIYMRQMDKKRNLSLQGSVDTQTSTYSQVCSSTVASTPRAVDHILKDSDKMEVSNCRGHSPEESTMKNGDTNTTRPSAEYDGIVRKAADICSKKEGESPVVLKTLGSTVEELVSRNPALTLNYKPSKEEYKSTWRNVDNFDKQAGLCTEDIDKAGDNLSNVGNHSKPSERPATSAALETVEMEAKNSLPHYTADKVNVKIPSGQNSKQNVESALRSSGPEGNYEADFQKIPEKEVHTQNNKGIFDIMQERLNFRYDDIVNGPQMHSHDASLQNYKCAESHNQVQQVELSVNAPPFENAEIQYENISDDEGLVTENFSTQLVTLNTPAPPSPADNVRPLHQQISCPHAYFIETDDGDFEERPCPKCVQTAFSQSQTEDFSSTQEPGSEVCENVDLACHSQSTIVMDVDSEDDDDDEWLVVPLIAVDVKLEQESLNLDDNDSGNEGDECPLSQEQQNSPIRSHIQQMQTYDTWESFTEQTGIKPPDEDTWKAFPKNIPSTSNSPKLHTDTFKPSSDPCMEITDSCDTDDSADYPSQAKPNYLTASSRVRAPSPLYDRDEDSEEDVEVSQSPDYILPGSPPQSMLPINTFFPNITSDEDEYSGNNVKNTSVLSTVSGRPFKKACKTKHLEGNKSNTLQKKRLKNRVITSDSENEDSQDMRNDSSKICKTSIQANQKSLISLLDHPESDHPGPEQSQNSNSASSKISKQIQTVKRKGLSETLTSAPIQKRGKRTRSSLDEERRMDQNLSKKSLSGAKLPGNNIAGSLNLKTRNQNTKAIAAETRKQFPISSHSRTLSLDGARYMASSLPGNMHSQSNNQKSFNPVNSYSTDKSTPAKQRLVKEWENEHVPTRKERRTSYERDPSTRNAVVKATSARDHEIRGPVRPPPRQRHISNDSPLMKRTKSEARMLTHHTHRQGPIERNPENPQKLSGYKWGNDHLSTNGLDLDRERFSPELPKGFYEQ